MPTGRPSPSVVGSVGTAPMLDPVDLQHGPFVVRDAGEAVLSHPEFRERTARQGLEEVVRVRHAESTTSSSFETIRSWTCGSSPSNWSAARCANFQVQFASLVILVAVHHLDDFVP
jgi:hypothetical protein